MIGGKDGNVSLKDFWRFNIGTVHVLARSLPSNDTPLIRSGFRFTEIKQKYYLKLIVPLL
jgi:hypothetical protein